MNTIVLSKSPEEILLDLDEVEQLVQQISKGVTAYSTFILLEVLEHLEGHDIPKLKSTFDAYITMKEYVNREYQKEQEQGRNGEQGKPS